MELYFRKEATTLKEEHSEIMSKSMVKAKNVVRITLTSSPPMKPQENPKIICDIFRQHFSEVTFFCMPLANSVAGETPVEYCLRLNKAVHVAEE